MKTKLLLLHGALGTRKQLEPLLLLLEKEVELYSMNFEGHGGRESSQPFSIHLFTENVKAFLEKNEIENTHVFGYSMGGYVALNLALQHPSLVTKIITLGTKFDWSPEAADKELKMLNPDKIEEKVPRFADKLRKDHHPSDWKEVVRKTAAMMKGMGAGAALGLEEFSQIKQPVIIGVGEKDRMVTTEESELISRQLYNGKVVILPDVPHPIDQVDPQVLAEFVLGNL